MAEIPEEEPEPRTTVANILDAIERLKPKPVKVYCHADDLDRITAACEQLPTVQVAVSSMVPQGQVYVLREVYAPMTYQPTESES